MSEIKMDEQAQERDGLAEKEIELEETDGISKPYKVRNVSRDECKGISAISLEDVKKKAAKRYNHSDLPKIHLDADGTEVDDEDYFQTLDGDTELVAVFEGEKWIDPAKYIVKTSRSSGDMTDSTIHGRCVNLRNIVLQLKNDLTNISVLSDPELQMITNMDNETEEDEEFVHRLKEVSTRFLQDKQIANDAIRVLKLISTDQGVKLETHGAENTSDQQQETNELTINLDSSQQTLTGSAVIEQQFRLTTSNPPDDAIEQVPIEQPSTSINVKKPTSEDI
ncbi:DNA fragmentation factor subunit alpha-like [Contarinia nasturtii]|uniref:DNA fragmentation factor subunit alpha-like n=1 Tax=Contarinia nasturtii TaxID=265458 RepID=UPI0012D41B78|nr:DNA fragmentation factor subunit alpha-like [Contarinia nasturtii]